VLIVIVIKRLGLRYVKATAGMIVKNRCYNCNKLFSGELVVGQYDRNIASSITAAMRHADSKGITCQIQIRPNETNIYYHGKK